MIAPGDGISSRLVVHGSRATMRVDNPLAPQFGSALQVASAGGSVDYPVATSPTYLHQLQAFRDAIVTDAPFPTTAREGTRTMQLIDACYRAAGLEPRPTRPTRRGE
jgi:predicted dehydrogenase